MRTPVHAPMQPRRCQNIAIQAKAKPQGELNNETGVQAARNWCIIHGDEKEADFIYEMYESRGRVDDGN